jgi:Holliday junction resolvasome RuvABC endonuclease subunit
MSLIEPEFIRLPKSNTIPTTRAILALDLGTTTGWAVRNTRGRIISGTAEFKPHRFEGGGMRYLRFTQWLGDVLKTVPELEAVYFEEVRRHIGVAAAHAYGGFLGNLTAWCEEQGLPYQGVPVGTIKRFISGKGNADKAMVMAALRSRGFTVKDDNEADAIAILLWAISKDGGAA